MSIKVDGVYVEVSPMEPERSFFFPCSGPLCKGLDRSYRYTVRREGEECPRCYEYSLTGRDNWAEIATKGERAKATKLNRKQAADEKAKIKKRKYKRRML